LLPVRRLEGLGKVPGERNVLRTPGCWSSAYVAIGIEIFSAPWQLPSIIIIRDLWQAWAGIRITIGRRRHAAAFHLRIDIIAVELPQPCARVDSADTPGTLQHRRFLRIDMRQHGVSVPPTCRQGAHDGSAGLRVAQH
jgi:hypothetical protein